MGLSDWDDIEPLLRQHMHGDPEAVRIALEQERAWVWRCPDGFAVLSTQLDDFGARELFVWVAVGRNTATHLDALRAVARQHGCSRIVTSVVRDGVLRLLQRHGWTPRSVELAMEV